MGYLRKPIDPYDRPPKSPHFHRPQSEIFIEIVLLAKEKSSFSGFGFLFQSVVLTAIREAACRTGWTTNPAWKQCWTRWKGRHLVLNRLIWITKNPSSWLISPMPTGRFLDVLALFSILNPIRTHSVPGHDPVIHLVLSATTSRHRLIHTRIRNVAAAGLNLRNEFPFRMWTITTTGSTIVETLSMERMTSQRLMIPRSK